MNELIKVDGNRIGSEIKQTVNARDLHEFLEVATRFNDWITVRINDFEFKENQDFVTFTENSVKGRPAKEYALSLEMAKELSMVERNDKGKQARLYFIECEKSLKEVQLALPQTYSQALEALLYEVKEKERLEMELQSKEAVIEEKKAVLRLVEPKAKALDRISASSGSLNLRDTAKAFNLSPQKQLYEIMDERNMIYRNRLGNWNATQTAINVGLMEQRPYVDNSIEYLGVIRYQPMVTGKGLAFLSKLLGVVDLRLAA